MPNGRGAWDEAERELVFVTAAIRATVTRLLRGGEISPQTTREKTLGGPC